MIDHTGSKPAPGRLRLIQAFVNTAEISPGREDFDSPDALREWLLAHALILPDAVIDGEALRAARGAREALRSMLLANNGATPDPAAIEALEHFSLQAGLTLRFRPDGCAVLAAHSPGIEGALGALFAIVFEATIDGTWSRLKACPDEECKWAFFDHSRNRSGTWCTMATCGNRHKARQYRDRKRMTANQQE
jgi:predicted RNA-binding Zn ribbon-like protein